MFLLSAQIGFLISLTCTISASAVIVNGYKQPFFSFANQIKVKEVNESMQESGREVCKYKKPNVVCNTIDRSCPVVVVVAAVAVFDSGYGVH